MRWLIVIDALNIALIHHFSCWYRAMEVAPHVTNVEYMYGNLVSTSQAEHTQFTAVCSPHYWARTRDRLKNMSTLIAVWLINIITCHFSIHRQAKRDNLAFLTRHAQADSLAQATKQWKTQQIKTTLNRTLSYSSELLRQNLVQELEL